MPCNGCRRRILNCRPFLSAPRQPGGTDLCQVATAFGPASTTRGRSKDVTLREALLYHVMASTTIPAADSWSLAAGMTSPAVRGRDIREPALAGKRPTLLDSEGSPPKGASWEDESSCGARNIRGPRDWLDRMPSGPMGAAMGVPVGLARSRPRRMGSATNFWGRGGGAKRID